MGSKLGVCVWGGVFLLGYLVFVSEQLLACWTCIYTGAKDAAGRTCNRALDAIRSIRERLRHSSGTVDAAAEHQSNFAPYAKTNKGSKPSKATSWTLRMVCLSRKEALRVPCSVGEREELVEAGLGEKKVVVLDISCSAEEFKSAMISAFPKLRDCGGFELLRCIANTKNLEVISLAVSQSPQLLKSVVGAGRVFIRPSVNCRLSRSTYYRAAMTGCINHVCEDLRTRARYARDN